jgi:hypothetical protein
MERQLRADAGVNAQDDRRSPRDGKKTSRNDRHASRDCRLVSPNFRSFLSSWRGWGKNKRFSGSCHRRKLNQVGMPRDGVSVTERSVR